MKHLQRLPYFLLEAKVHRCGAVELAILAHSCSHCSILALMAALMAARVNKPGPKPGTKQQRKPAGMTAVDWKAVKAKLSESRSSKASLHRGRIHSVLH